MMMMVANSYIEGYYVPGTVLNTLNILTLIFLAVFKNKWQLVSDIWKCWGIKKFLAARCPVTHACNPSYSGGRDREDHSSKPAGQFARPISKKPITKRADGMAQGVGPKFKPQYCKKKKKEILGRETRVGNVIKART
jgi:hypothetical protein